MSIIINGLRLIGMIVFGFGGTAYVQNDFNGYVLTMAVGLALCLVAEVVEHLAWEEDEEDV